MTRPRPTDAALNGLETLAETRLTLVQAARYARETRDFSAAKELAERAEALKGEIAKVRKTLHQDWTSMAEKTRIRIIESTTRLSRDLQRSEKAKSITERAFQIVLAASKFFVLTRRLL